MNLISNRELYAMSLEPLKRHIRNRILDWKIRSADRHIESLSMDIVNMQQAIRVLQHERMLLSVRRRG